ncbi:MAG TPA: hypothetical protein VK612_07355, partial [Pyrinomonadaceae bacterium]|nr:hypothetical protein [Pyrinomonadaceae bacterium]
MFRKFKAFNAVLSFITLFSTLLSGLAIETRASDLVPSDDLAGGASVFVFRTSKKQPQERGAVRSFRAGGASATVRRERIKTQVVSARKRKADAAKARAAAVAKARARERNAKLKLSNTLAARAEIQLEKGEIAGATVNFRESLKANPKNEEAKRGLSEALTANGIATAGDSNNEAAMPYFTEAIKFDPQNEAAFAKLGEIHDAKGRNDQAILNYEQALKVEPNFSSLYLPLGL